MKFSREAFWDARKSPLIFFAVAFAIGISVNFFSSWLQCYAWAGWVFGLGVPVLLLAVIASPLIERVWRYPDAVPVIIPKARSCKGLVVVMSLGRGSGSARAAILYHAKSLERIWIVQSKSSADESLKVVREVCAATGLDPNQFSYYSLTDEEFSLNPERVKDLIEEEVYGNLGDLSPEDIVIDITGGTKVASVGASLVGLPRGRRLEVVGPAGVDENGYATAAGDPFEIVMDYGLKSLRRR